MAFGRESFFWHKLHSLTGIVPVGFYMVQHLTLNSFSLAGPDKYNGVAGFFYSMPHHILLAIEFLVVLLPLTFHAVYGLFITSRATPNYSSTPYKWFQNRMYNWQRYTGVFLFVFLIYHVITTTLKVKLANNDPSVVDYYRMADMLSGYGYAVLAFYVLGVFAASYHFSFGIWNFCIRWGITISPNAQRQVEKAAMVVFLVLTVLGWAALWGFFQHPAPTTTSA